MRLTLRKIGISTALSVISSQLSHWLTASRLATLTSIMIMVGCVSQDEGPLSGWQQNEYIRSGTPAKMRFWYGMPIRQNQAVSGNQFIANTSSLNQSDRENEILKQLRRGNIPSHQRFFRAITFKTALRGRTITATIWVLPDYLALGSDNDFVRMPMNPMTAQKLADQFGVMLPTRKLVDIIYQNAQVKLQPSTMTPGPTMASNQYIKNHNDKIEAQLRGGSRNLIIAGHKKDVVISNRLNEKPRRVAIYGWHRGTGNPIQPLSIVHDNRYADYSHGIRLIAPTMLLEGVEVPVAEILEDPVLAYLISDEGPIRPTRVKLD